MFAKFAQPAWMRPIHMTYFDILFTGIILISTISALFKGLVREIISLAALILGFILAVFFYPIPSAKLLEFCRTESIANLLGFLSIFLGCILLGAITTFIVNRFVKAASLKWVDRLMGAIFGVLRGWIISSILVVAIIAFPIRDNLMAHSALAPYLLAGARILVHMTPKALTEKFNEQYQKVLKTWNESRNSQ
jgi:membrane protein required for colicin V production